MLAGAGRSASTRLPGAGTQFPQTGDKTMVLYRARHSGRSAFWQCAHRHFATFVEIYPQDYQPRLGPLRPVIPQVVHKFFDCRNLDCGFAKTASKARQKRHLTPTRSCPQSSRVFTRCAPDFRQRQFGQPNQHAGTCVKSED